MIEKIKQLYNRVKTKISSHPTYVKFIQKRDKLADRMLVALLAFFDAISPVLTFLCINKVDPDEETGKSVIHDELILVIKFCLIGL